MNVLVYKNNLNWIEHYFLAYYLNIYNKIKISVLINCKLFSW